MAKRADDHPVSYAVVGADSTANFQLSHTLRQLRGAETVHRFLEFDHAKNFVVRYKNGPLVIILDLFGADLREGTDFIGGIRDDHPKAVFVLYVDHGAYLAKRREVPRDWQKRINHYYMLHKSTDSTVEFELSVRASLQAADWEARHNVTNEPIRLTPVFEKGLRRPAQDGGAPIDTNIAFVSYARKDWDDFVSGLVTDLSQQNQRVWLDQEFIAGGEDWLDAVGQALQICDKLLLILSPDSVSSKYVRMEYRYFFLQNKPIIPILYRQIDQMPFELATLNYIDFSRGEILNSKRKLREILARRAEEK